MLCKIFLLKFLLIVEIMLWKVFTIYNADIRHCLLNVNWRFNNLIFVLLQQIHEYLFVLEIHKNEEIL